MFKKSKGIRVPYNKQGFIYFLCKNYNLLPFKYQVRIDKLCDTIAGEHSKALFYLLTDDTKNIHGVALKYHLSETQLYFYKKRFYEKFFK